MSSWMKPKLRVKGHAWWPPFPVFANKPTQKPMPTLRWPTPRFLPKAMRCASWAKPTSTPTPRQTTPQAGPWCGSHSACLASTHLNAPDQSPNSKRGPTQVGVPPGVVVVGEEHHGREEQRHQRGQRRQHPHGHPRQHLTSAPQPRRQSPQQGEPSHQPPCELHRGASARRPWSQTSMPPAFPRKDHLARERQRLAVQRHVFQLGREDIWQKSVAACRHGRTGVCTEINSIPHPVQGNPAMKGRKASR